MAAAEVTGCPARPEPAAGDSPLPPRCPAGSPWRVAAGRVSGPHEAGLAGVRGRRGEGAAAYRSAVVVGGLCSTPCGVWGRAVCGAGPGLRRRPLRGLHRGAVCWGGTARRPEPQVGSGCCVQSVPQAGSGGFSLYRHLSGFLGAELSVSPRQVFA